MRSCLKHTVASAACFLLEAYGLARAEEGFATPSTQALRVEASVNKSKIAAIVRMSRLAHAPPEDLFPQLENRGDYTKAHSI